ncbi:bifunctional 4-hydroxy-2-oxoglutarate aldolase/2-dehydro-3-deoxy-phosphogluconate aldolase [Pseudomonas sp. HK3]
MKANSVDQILTATPVMPVIVIDDLADAVPLARALVAGGIKVLEITLRSSVALEAIADIIANVPDAIVGAGTITSVEQLEQVEALGVQFALSPGITESLLIAAKKMQLQYVPAVATPSELMLGLEHGFDRFKLFPASVVGGREMLKALNGPFPEIGFCPTGGLTLDNFAQVLALPNVKCVGGSWLAPKDLVKKKDWKAITELALTTVAKSNG